MWCACSSDSCFCLLRSSPGLEKYIVEDHPELGSLKFPDPNGPDIKAYLVDLFKKLGKEPKPPITVTFRTGEISLEKEEFRCDLRNGRSF